MNTRIIATLAIVGTIFTSSFGTAHAGVLFEVVKSVGKEIVHKAVADKQEREMRAYQQQRAQQRRVQQARAQRQRAPEQPAGQAVQALPAGSASGAATTNAETGSQL